MFCIMGVVMQETFKLNGWSCIILTPVPKIQKEVKFTVPGKVGREGGKERRDYLFFYRESRIIRKSIIIHNRSVYHL